MYNIAFRKDDQRSGQYIQLFKIIYFNMIIFKSNFIVMCDFDFCKHVLLVNSFYTLS